MKKIVIIFFIFLINCSFIRSMSYNSVALLKKSKVSLSIGSYLDAESGFGFLLINDIGLLNRLNSIVRLGVVKQKETAFYAGLEGKILVLNKFGGTDKLSIILGGHYNKNMGIDTALLIGNTFFKVENFIGLDFTKVGCIRFMKEVKRPNINSLNQR